MARRAIGKDLGELLVGREVITADQLQNALKVRQSKGGLLTQILVSLGYTTEEAVAQAVTAECGFPYLPLKNYQIDPQLLKIVPENVARQYCLIPIDQIGDTLTVAMADPLNAKVVEDIELLSHCSVQVFVSTTTEVVEAIQRSYQGDGHA